MLSKKDWALSSYVLFGVAFNINSSLGTEGQIPLTTEEAWQEHKRVLLEAYHNCMNPCLGESLLTEDFSEVVERCEKNCPTQAAAMHEAEAKYDAWKTPQLFSKKRSNK